MAINRLLLPFIYVNDYVTEALIMMVNFFVKLLNTNVL